jgi:hypothetical protein
LLTHEGADEAPFFCLTIFVVIATQSNRWCTLMRAISSLIFPGLQTPFSVMIAVRTSKGVRSYEPSMVIPGSEYSFRENLNVRGASLQVLQRA